MIEDPSYISTNQNKITISPKFNSSKKEFCIKKLLTSEEKECTLELKNEIRNLTHQQRELNILHYGSSDENIQRKKRELSYKIDFKKQKIAQIEGRPIKLQNQKQKHQQQTDKKNIDKKEKKV